MTELFHTIRLVAQTDFTPERCFAHSDADIFHTCEII
jgi:hypothetical protein